jgi:hypothetical protein
MHDLSCETLLTKYTLRGIARDPITGTALALTAAGTAVSAAGTIAGGKAAADAGARAKEGYDFKALQEEQAAQESRAVGQRAALEKRREARFLTSKLQARAAASGGAADDPGVIDLAGDIAERGEYDALMEMFKGENRARGLEDSATGSRMTGEAAYAEGQAKRDAAELSAMGTIISGAGSMFRQYNKIDRYG